MDGTFLCTECSIEYAVDQAHRMNKDGTGWCKECRRVYRRAWYEKNRESAIAYSAEWKSKNRDRLPGYGRKSRYGISDEQFNEMLKDQDNLCAICREDFGPRGPRVDHCHSAGDVRELLCDSCNTGLGMFSDSPEKLIAAAEYLRKHKGL